MHILHFNDKRTKGSKPTIIVIYRIYNDKDRE